MFTIIGGDGREYGPATAEQIRAWIASGRANLDTKAKSLGSDEWRRLGDFAEFAGPSAPPPVPTMPPTAPIGGPMPGAMPTTATIPAATGAAGASTAAVALDPNLAERGPRLLARFIDWALEFAIAIPGGAILGGEFMKLAMAVMQGRQPDFEELDIKRLILGGSVLAGAWLILLIVQVWMLTTRGQSIGKRIVGLRIVKLDGSAPGIVHAWLMREFLMSVFGFVLSFLPIIGPLMLRPALHITDWCMIFRDDRRCVHDLLAGTKVVRA
jgi:uncharacterized RDD family membrane protein YckC